MTPQEVIDNAPNMSIWDNAVWVNAQQGTFFVPIWRNGNTKFLHIAEQYGYTLEKNYDLTNLIGYAFIRQPEKRIVGQLHRAMVNQNWSFEEAVNNVKGLTKHELDVHLLTQKSFLENYNITYCIDLDRIRKTGHEHIDSVLDKFMHDDQRLSQVIDETFNELITPEILELYACDKMPTVGIVGVGNIGSVLYNALTQKNIDVKRFDIVKEYNTIEEVSECDIIWICVDTPTTEDHGDFDYTNLKRALNYFKNKTIIVGCTVSPGTCKTLHTTNNIIYMPFLISQGDVLQGLISPDCWFIGGEYNRDVANLVSRLSSSEQHWGTYQEAELAKALYNSWIIQKINFANWASDLAYEVVGNADAGKVMQWLGKSDKLITSNAYMKPGWGDGGPCHPRDNLMMSWISKQGLNYDPALNQHTIRLAQAELMAKRALQFKLPVIILGKSYKYGVDSIEGSYSIVVADYIKQLGGTVYFEDHLTSGDYCYILAHNHFYGHNPSEGSIVINPWV